MSEPQTFFAYYDDNQKIYYYFNPETEESLWEYPENGIVLDPETNELFPNPATQNQTEIPGNKTIPEEHKSGDVEIPKIEEESTGEQETTQHEHGIKRKEFHEAEDIKPRKNIKIRPRHHTTFIKSPSVDDLGVREFRKNSCFLSITDDGLPPLLLQVDESILNFDPMKTPQEEMAEIDNDGDNQFKSQTPRRPSFSYLQINDSYGSAPKSSPLNEMAEHQNDTQNENSDDDDTLNLIPDSYELLPAEPDKPDQQEVPTQINEIKTEESKQEPVKPLEEHVSEPVSEQEPHQEDEKQNIANEEEEHKEEEDKKYKYILPTTNPGEQYLPTDCDNGAKAYTLDKYAIQYFKPYTKSRWNKQTVSLEELVSFTNDPIPSPLLKFLPNSLQKPAVKMFKLILEYTQKGNKQAAVEIVEIISKDKELIDEAYFQVMKQTSGAPDVNVLIKTWHIFLIVSTIFPSSPGCQIWIKSHIARSMYHENIDVKTYARFTFIRFSARCSVGTQKEDVTPEYILSIPQHPFTSITVFGCSLYEIMWSQRRSVPNCPIPYILVQMIHKLIEKDCFHREGIFRLPGNMRKVNEMAENANLGEDALSKASIDDIASLMKKWFRELCDMVVPNQFSEYVGLAVKEGKCIEFASALPPVNSMTLAYLIGFLQELSKYQEFTKMGIENLAMVFSPNIVSPDVNGQASAQNGQTFLHELIDHWDVSSIYSLQLE